jgi:uncharacterized protein YfaP (DUF2135 family)
MRLQRALFLLTMTAVVLLPANPSWATTAQRCSPSSTVACLQNGRFRIQVDWIDQKGRTKAAQVVPMGSNRSAVFSFDRPANWEVLVNTLDGCALNKHYWVFSAGTTRQNYTVRVTDFVSSKTRSYTTKPSRRNAAVADTAAFTCAKTGASQLASEDAMESQTTDPRQPNGAPKELSAEIAALPEFVKASSCTASEDRDCLLNGRFKVELSWVGPGIGGRAKPTSTDSDTSTAFSFQGSDGWDMLLKIVDECSSGGGFGIYAGAPTTLKYDLRITDTFTGAVQVYSNPLGKLAVPISQPKAFTNCEVGGPPRVEFLSDRSVALPSHGATAILRAQVVDFAGRAIPGAEISWTSSNPDAVEVAPSGSQSAVVTAIGYPPLSAVVSARYRDSRADAVIALATPTDATVLLPSDTVLSIQGNTVHLRRTPLTLALSTGQVLVTGDRAGLLDRILSVQFLSDQVVLDIEPAKVIDAFSELEIGVRTVASTVSATSDKAGSQNHVSGVEVPGKTSCEVNGVASLDIHLEDEKIEPVFDLSSAFLLRISKDGGFFSRGIVEEFVVSVSGTVGIQMSTPTLVLGPAVGGEVECKRSLGTIPVPFLSECATLACAGFTLRGEVGFKATGQFEVADLRLSGPSGGARGTVGWTLQYLRDQPWKSYGNGSLTGNLDLFTADAQHAGFTADFQVFARGVLGLGLTVGRIGVGVDVGDITGFGYGRFSLHTVDLGNVNYLGPDWDLGLGISGELSEEITSSKLSTVLSLAGINTHIEGVSLELFDVRKPLASAPKFHLGINPASVLAGKSSAQLSLRATKSANGTAEFLDSKDGGRFASLGTAAFSGDTATLTWSPKASDTGSHRILARAVTDPLSSILPYAADNVGTLAVVAGGNNPPTISSVSPNPVTGSSSPQLFTILGSNFVSGANVTLQDLTSGQVLPNRTTSSFSSTQITLNPVFSTAAHRWSVEVINPDGQSSGQFAFQVNTPTGNPAPSIASVSPNPVTGSNSAQPFNVLGSNFVSGANVTLRDLNAGQIYANRPASSFSGTQITLNPIFGTTAHSWSVEVINPDGQSSGQFQFQVNAPVVNPAPSISSVSPNPVTGSNSSQPFTIFGSNFVSGANVTLRDLSASQTFSNRTVSSFSSTQIVINSNFTTAAHTWSVEVINPDGKSSGQFQFQVVAPGEAAPAISSVSPNPVTGSNSSQPFTIFGSNFVSGANVTLRDLSAGQTFPNRTASSFSSTQIALNPIFTAAAHLWSVEVINPDGQSSGQFQFQVVAPGEAAPAISSVSPSPVTGSNSSQPFTVFGSNFVSGANVTLRDLSAGQTFPNRAASSFSSTQIVLNPIFTTAAHLWSVEVINPDGQSSGQFQFQVVAPSAGAPLISSVSPNPVTGSNSSQPFTIVGSNFVSGANVTLRDLSAGQTFPNRAASSFSSTQIVVNPIFTTAAHLWSVEVINPDGQSSGQFQFQVVAPSAAAPSISSVSPNPVTGSNSSQPFTILGSNFVSGANVTLRDLSAGQTFPNRAASSFTSMQIVVNPIFTTAAHLWSVEVINPDGQSSGQFQFQVVAPSAAAPSISSVSPNPVTGSNSSQPFTISGSNFLSGANVTLRDLSAGQTFPNRAASSFTSTQIVLNPIFTTAAHLWSVEVINPDSQSSGQFQFQVVAPSAAAPLISSVSPNPVTGSNSSQPFTIFGSNFVSGANVTLRDLSAGQTFPNRSASSFSSSQIVINPSFTTAAHTWSVEVINPDGQSSGQFQFQVVAPSAPAPSISSVSPNPVTGSNSSQPFTIFGSNFVSGANVTLRDLSAGQTFSNRSASSFSSSQIVINPTFTTAAHTWSVEVINPDGKSSGQFQFQVVAPSAPAPSINSVSPNPVTGSNSSQPFTIFGSNFVSGANVTLRDLSAGQTFSNRSASSFSSSQIVINPTFTTAAHTWSVEVINPDGKSSGQFQFQVVAPSAPAPSINSVSPNPVTGSNTSQPFTIFGSNFVSGANVTLRDLSAGQTFPNRTASSFSSTQIVINPNFTTAIHTWSVEVINPDGKSSGQFQFQVH